MGTARVLIVDDEEIIRLFLWESLAPDYAIAAVPSAEEALELNEAAFGGSF